MLVIWFLAASLLAPAASGQGLVPKVGLALSGGGARGAAHIGVLKILEREKIPVNYIAGTSFGALVGGLYALGFTADEIEQIFVRQDWSTVFSNAPDLSLAPLNARAQARYQGKLDFKGFIPELPSGLLAGQRLIEVLDGLTTERMLAAGFDFDKLAIPFRAVATNLVNGDRYVFHDGPMTEAIRASLAIPLLFTPVEKDGMLLVDGGLVDNLPTDVVREMGADIVIAVNVTSPLLEKEQIKTFLEVVDQSVGLLMRRDVEANLKLADLVLQPDLNGFTASDYTRIAAITQAGILEAETRLPSLKALTARLPAQPLLAPPVLQAVPIIASVSFEGLADIPSGQLHGEVKARPGNPLNVPLLEEDLRRLYATGLFEQVDYRLVSVGDNRYDLVYHLREASLHTLGGSIRYDFNYRFVALAEYRARQVFHTPSLIILSAQFGGIDHDFATLRYVPTRRLPFLFLAPEIHLDKREFKDIQEETLVDQYNRRQIGGQLMLGMLFKQSELEIGYRADRNTVTGGTPPNRQDGVQYLRGLRAHLERNTLDSQRFPSSGMLIDAMADKSMTLLGSDLDYSKWDLDVSRYFPLSKKSNLLLHGGAGYSRGSVPFYERFYIGGFNFAEGGPRRLIGFDFDELSALQMGILSVGYRYQWYTRPLGFAKRSFLSGYYNAALISGQHESPYDFNLFQGAGAEISFDTRIGPIRLAGGWGQGGRFNLYFTFGPSF